MHREFSCRDVRDAFRGSLHAKVFHFSTLWNRVSCICNIILCWDKSPDFRGQKAIELVMEAYTLVYRLTSCRCSDCPLLRRGDMQSNPVQGDDEEATQVLVVYYLLRETLRQQLTATVASSLFSIAQENPSKLLEAYLKDWRSYVVAINNLRVVFSYLHEPWQKCGLPDDHPLLPIDVLALLQWNESVLQAGVRSALSAHMRTYFIQDMERPLDAKTSNLIKEFGNSLVKFADPRHELYVSLIEDGYVSLLSDYYSKNVNKMKEKGVLWYIQSCLKTLQFEETRAHRFLVNTSLSAVMRKLTEILIDKEIRFLESRLHEWINYTDTDHLHKLYLLLSKSPMGMTNLRGAFQSLVYERGMNDISSACNKITLACYLNREVIKVIISVYSFFEQKLPAFDDAVILENAMLSGLEEILKCTPYVKSTKILAYDLALFAHEKLRVKIYDVKDHLKTLKNIVILFKLLPSKTSFCDAYPKYLSQRLLAESFHLEYERFAINQIAMTNVSTGDFLHRCEVMLSDVTEKHLELRKEYSETVKGEKKKWDFRPIVLSSYSWTDIHTDNDFLPWPSFIEDTLINFGKFYATHYPRRHVVYSSRHSRGTLKMNLPAGARFSELEIRVGQPHLLIAEKFNSNTKWSYRELLQAGGENYSEVCSRAIMSYIKKGILEVSGSAKESGSIRYEDMISVVKMPNVRSEKVILFEETEVHRVLDYNQPLEETDHVDAAHTVPMEGPVIQAILIRIFKANKSLPFNALLEKTQDECSRGFAPSVPETKVALEFLIERGFIARDDSKNDVFTYIS